MAERQAGDRDVCWFCGGRLCWDSDFNYDEVHGDGEGIVAFLHCMDCGAQVEYSQRTDVDEDGDPIEKTETEEAAMAEVTPIGETYFKKEYSRWLWFTELKNRYKDALLLFKVGNHYEANFDDAIVLKKLFGLTAYPPIIGQTNITGYIAVLENEGYKVQLLTEEAAP